MLLYCKKGFVLNQDKMSKGRFGRCSRHGISGKFCFKRQKIKCSALLVYRRIGCLPSHHIAFQNSREFWKMLVKKLDIWEVESQKSQMRPRRWWIAPLAPKQCRSQQSAGNWGSKFLDVQGARHGVHYSASGLAYVVGEKSLGNWWDAY